MPLTFTKAEMLALKGHHEFSEKWLQQRIIDDPSIIGLGDVEVLNAEKILPKAGRLDLLLHEDQLNRRYEVELMLGATDPSHIIRCIEYYDIERRRYPAYDHVAVLIAEDITSRFLNVMSLLAGSIPLIAIQLTALQVDDKIVVHFTRVLDQTELRADDEYEYGDEGDAVHVGPEWWQQKAPSAMLSVAHSILGMVNSVAPTPYRFEYKKNLINIVSEDGGVRRAWVKPKKTILGMGAFVAKPEEWVKRFEGAGLPTGLRYGNKAAKLVVTPDNFEAHRALIAEFIEDAVTATDDAG